MDNVVITKDPEGECFPFVVAASLHYWNNANPVPLGQDPFCGEAHSMGIDQLLGGIVDRIVRETNHRTHLWMHVDACGVCMEIITALKYDK